MLKKCFAFMVVVILFAACITFAGPAFAQSSDEAKKIWEQGEKALKEGKNREAVGFYERSLSISRRLNDLEGNAGNLSGLGQAYEALGDYPKALSYYEESLATNRRRQNKDGIATNLYNIGVLQYMRFQRNDRAVPLLEQSLSLFRELKDRESIATVVYWLGRIQNGLGQYDKALAGAREAAKLSRELNNRQDLAYALNLAGLACTGLGKYDEALASFQEAMQINKSLNLPLETAVSLRNLGDAYTDLVQFDQAMAYYEQSLSALRKLDNKDETAITLNNLGLLYSSLSQYDKALAAYQESLRISREVNSTALIAVSLNNVGQVQGSLGKLDESLANYHQSLELERQLNRPARVAIVLNNIGMFYYRLGRGDKALPYLLESLEIQRKANAPSAMAQCLDNIGAVYLSQKDYTKAEQAFLERRGLQRKFQRIFLRHAGLTELYLVTGRSDEAIALLQERPPKWNEGSQFRAEYHTQYGRALKGKGRLKDATRELLAAVNTTEEIRQAVRERSDFFGGGVAIGRLMPYRALVSVLADRAEAGETPEPELRPYGKDMAAAAWYFAEMTKARTLLETMVGSAGKYDDPDIPRATKVREEEMVRQLAEIEQGWNDAFRKGGAVFDRLAKRKEALNREMQALIAMFREKYPRYAALAYPKPVPPESLPLKDDEVLIAYSIGEENSRAFVVGKGGIRGIVRINLPKPSLEEKIRAYVAPFVDGSLKEFSPDAGRELYDLLLADALKRVGPKEQVMISADGVLGLLPFESLAVPGGKAAPPVYLADRYRPAYIQSGTALAVSRYSPASMPKRTLFALGNPIYDERDPRYAAYKAGRPVQIAAPDLKSYAYRGITVQPASSGSTGKGTGWEAVVYEPLPETEDEVRAIAALFGISPQPPDVLLNIYANGKYLRQSNLAEYRYLHFATHADLPGKVQGIMEPFIILGQVGNDSRAEGFLTLSKVLGLRLQADMVVLSACSTGRGRMQEGEGIASFARAFQYAGARSVVVSLWEVSSEATVLFMKSFYGHLKAGKGRADALGLARIEIKAKYPNPFYWAPFVLYGENR